MGLGNYVRLVMEGGANFVFGEEHWVINVVIDAIRIQKRGLWATLQKSHLYPNKVNKL